MERKQGLCALYRKCLRVAVLLLGLVVESRAINSFILRFSLSLSLSLSLCLSFSLWNNFPCRHALYNRHNTKQDSPTSGLPRDEVFTTATQKLDEKYSLLWDPRCPFLPFRIISSRSGEVRISLAICRKQNDGSANISRTCTSSNVVSANRQNKNNNGLLTTASFNVETLQLACTFGIKRIVSYRETSFSKSRLANVAWKYSVCVSSL